MGYPAAYRPGSGAFAGYPGFQGGGGKIFAPIEAGRWRMPRLPSGPGLAGALIGGAIGVGLGLVYYYNQRDSGVAAGAGWSPIGGWCEGSQDSYACGPTFKSTANGAVPYCVASTISCDDIAALSDAASVEAGGTGFGQFFWGRDPIFGFQGQKYSHAAGEEAWPVPAYVPEGMIRPLPGVVVIPAGTHPKDLPIGVPVVLETPTYRDRVGVTPAAGVVPMDLVPPQTRARPTVAFPTRAIAKTKERKMRFGSTMQAFMKAHGLYMNIFTETGDLVEAFWKAIPESERSNCGKRLDCMLKDLYAKADLIDVQKAAINVVTNQLEDMIIGKTVGTSQKGIGQTLGTPIGGGFGFGPIF